MIFQIFTRIYLNELAKELGRSATLKDISDLTIDGWAEAGFGFIWLLGIWQTGASGRDVSRSLPKWRSGFRHVLPDISQDDIAGSPFAIASYAVSDEFGGAKELIKFRRRLNQRSIRLLLDFVPNHTAIDHPWVTNHPNYYVHGSERLLQDEPQNYTQVETRTGPAILAHGRDPHFDGWADTVQLNFGYAAVQRAMTRELVKIAKFCDGVRCDMAMLVTRAVFSQTWDVHIGNGKPTTPVQEFWPVAIAAVRAKFPEFVLIAEVYWDLEWEIQQQGFDFAYDKQMYDRLRSKNAAAVRNHLIADIEYQQKLVRFIENHDEPRAAATFPPDVHQASALLAFLTPGLGLVYEGQLEGRQAAASVHLNRRQAETFDPAIYVFYQQLLFCLRRQEIRRGRWQLLEPQIAWEGNGTHNDMIAFCWRFERQVMLVVVNFGDRQSQSRILLDVGTSTHQDVELEDLIDGETFQRDTKEIASDGLFVDLPPWGYHVLVTKY